MELYEKEDGWRLTLREGVVRMIEIDFRLSLVLLDLSEKAQLHIETQCRLKGSGEEFLVTPSDTPTLAPILPLFNLEVVGIDIRKTGQLRVEFGDGHTLEIDPDDAYEAWQLGGSTGFMFVCSPGGAVSYFQR